MPFVAGFILGGLFVLGLFYIFSRREMQYRKPDSYPCPGCGAPLLPGSTACYCEGA